MTTKNQINLFVPGRLCLFGEHTDWAGKYRSMNADIIPGAAIVTGIEEGIEAIAEKSTSFEVTNTSEEIADIWEDFSCKMVESELKAVAKSGSFFSYCAGVASYMLEWYHIGGVKITITKMTLPIKSGLSSSAAICVLVARAFNLLYGLNLNTMGEMNIAYLGELRTSSRCGRLDQACAFGVKPVLMNFDGDEIDVKTLNVKKTLHWVFADLCGTKDTIKILRDLNKAYPFASDEKEEKLHNALGEKNQEIIERAISYMREGKVEELGKLMDESQRIFDEEVAPMSPEQLFSPKLKQYLNDAKAREYSYGAKGVGSHGDGSIQYLAKDKDSQEKLYQYLKSEGLKPYTLTIKPVHSVRKAIIPVAGFGTRLYPETRFLKKDFFPIIDSDGLVKPVIMILLEELVESGIEEICIVLGSEKEREQYREFFENALPEEHLSKLNVKMQEYEQKILKIGSKLTYVYQTEKKGFGHAVYQCKEFTQNEPVLLMLGDTIYHSHTNKPCALQLIEEFERINKPMIAIHETQLDQVSHYGIMTGTWENKAQTLMNIRMIKEKPTSNYAEQFLATKCIDKSNRYYCVFGQYILTPELFEQLESDVLAASDEKKEIELTSALDAVRNKIGMYGVILQGKMYDMGNPNSLKNTFTNY